MDHITDFLPARRVLLVGGGGREHALAWKITQSPSLLQLWVAPGNAGLETLPHTECVPIAADDVAQLLSFAQENSVGLTVVGPEAPLALGIVDAFQAAGLRIFGPTRAAALLETSKAFAKDFMWEVGIPTAPFITVSDYAAALDYVRQAERPLVVKASGLAAGKGVFVCDNLVQAEQALFELMQARQFGDAGDLVLIEERLTGPEVSLLAFSDGKTVVPMIAAQDHKRVFDQDSGPNTGGMGAYAPTPLLTPNLAADAVRLVLQPAVDGMAAQGTPYVGVLYAGLMLTPDGLRVLEFNARFGDPETQAILPLLESDLLDIFDACVDGKLTPDLVRWRAASAATVVAAAAGYPGAYEKGALITGVAAANALADTRVFAAGVRREENRLVTDGGRVLAVTGVGENLADAIMRAYIGVACIHFQGMHYRRDIGAKASRIEVLD